MPEDDYKKIFSKNLKYYMDKNGKNQMDLMKDLGFSSSTVSNWCTGLKLPRMDKVQILADYFGILKSDLIEDKSDSEVFSMSEKDFNQIFAKNLSRYLSNSNKTQREVADAIQVSPQTFNTWCQGVALPRMGKVQLLADYFQINKSDLIDKYEGFDISKKKKGIVIPVLGRVAAGIPIEAIEDIIDTEEITEEMAKTGEFFGLQIHGDSMGPKMDEGDIVIVRKQEDAESGDIVIASVNGDDATCKRLRKYRDGIELISSNPSYEPMFFSNEDIIKKPVKIIGKVVELRCKF